MFLPITNNVFARSLRRRCLALIAQIFTDICENLFALLTTYISTCASVGKWGWLWSKWGLVIVLHRYISASNYQRPAGQCDAISNWSTCNLFVVILSIWSSWHHWVTVPSFIRSLKGKHQTLFVGFCPLGWDSLWSTGGLFLTQRNLFGRWLWQYIFAYICLQSFWTQHWSKPVLSNS